ncbi:hypothetical protein PHYPSEUDO_008859 [Phytophthora pseudosyringae]|uniref:Uncharacterized protein n=1 Tax=Phytophthora pseudosyringae TaxID=221518 RepID=A0A8T1VGH0_9STRA|nr:hypothetical protein PHYPSEUDO_008859 [Phytophthora pseudosyringae]
MCNRLNRQPSRDRASDDDGRREARAGRQPGHMDGDQDHVEVTQLIDGLKTALRNRSPRRATGISSRTIEILTLEGRRERSAKEMSGAEPKRVERAYNTICGGARKSQQRTELAAWGASDRTQRGKEHETRACSRRERVDEDEELTGELVTDTSPENYDWTDERVASRVLGGARCRSAYPQAIRARGSVQTQRTGSRDGEPYGSEGQTQ